MPPHAARPPSRSVVRAPFFFGPRVAARRPGERTARHGWLPSLVCPSPPARFAPSIIAAITLAIALSACGSTVTTETSGGGSTSAGGASTGGAQVAGSSAGGVSMGGASTGGVSSGGASTGGATTGGGGAGGAPSCPGYGDACTDCLSSGCAATYCACYDEIHCFGYLQCLGTCMMGDAACAQNCATVHEPGISVAILVADCAATTCDADCQFGKALNACQKCLYTQCAPEMNACIADAECLALVQCIQACSPGDSTCSQACITAHPDGFSKAQGTGSCRKLNCADDCP